MRKLDIAKACVIASVLLSQKALFCAAGEHPVAATNTTEDTVVLHFSGTDKIIKPKSTEVILPIKGAKIWAKTERYAEIEKELSSINGSISGLIKIEEQLVNQIQPSSSIIINPEVDTKLEIRKKIAVGGRGKLVIIMNPLILRGNILVPS